jgi:hypothetical protein
MKGLVPFYVFLSNPCGYFDGMIMSSDFPLQLPECFFSPSNIERDESGKLIVDSDFLNYSSMNPDDIETSIECKGYILQLFAYLAHEEMSFKKFFGFNVIEYHGELFEYYLLLLERYLHLLAAEQAETGKKPRRLMTFSEDDDEAFLTTKRLAKLLLNMLEISYLEFPDNANIVPLLREVIYLFAEVFPDAFFLAILANFAESNIDSLFLADNEVKMMPSANQATRILRLFQSFDAIRTFPYFFRIDSGRFTNMIVLLLRDYCGEYSPEETHTMHLNVTLFFIYIFPDGFANQAIRDILPEEGKAILEEISKKRNTILGAISDRNQLVILSNKFVKFFGN